MRRWILPMVCAIALVSIAVVRPAHAGPFSLDNLNSGGAFDVEDDGAKTEAPAAAAKPAAEKPKPQPNAAGAARARASLNRQPRVQADNDLAAALNQTRGQCANGQCGRN